jgi:hypothetical protein
VHIETRISRFTCYKSAIEGNLPNKKCHWGLETVNYIYIIIYFIGIPRIESPGIIS